MIVEPDVNVGDLIVFHEPVVVKDDWSMYEIDQTDGPFMYFGLTDYGCHNVLQLTTGFHLVVMSGLTGFVIAAHFEDAIG